MIYPVFIRKMLGDITAMSKEKCSLAGCASECKPESSIIEAYEVMNMLQEENRKIILTAKDNNV